MVRGTNIVWENNPYISSSQKDSYSLDTQDPKFLYATPNSKEEHWKDIEDHIINFRLKLLNLPIQMIPRGELYLTEKEQDLFKLNRKFITIEPHSLQDWAPNKYVLSFKKYQNIVNKLRKDIEIVQISSPQNENLENVTRIKDENFRNMWNVIKESKLFIGNEGGSVHIATALGVKCLVSFGSYIPPNFVMYPQNINIFYGAHKPCGLRNYCQKCEEERPLFDENIIYEKAKEFLGI